VGTERPQRAGLPLQLGWSGRREVLIPEVLIPSQKLKANRKAPDLPGLFCAFVFELERNNEFSKNELIDAMKARVTTKQGA
jgi:hypothetical protein